MIAANKARHFHQMTSDIFKQEILGNLEKAGLSGLAAYTERAASQGKTMIPAVEGGVRSFLDGHNKLFQYGTAATKKIPKIVSHYIDGRGKTFSVMKQREEILDHLEKAGLPGAFSRSRQPRRFIGSGVAAPSAAATGAEVTAARNATHHIRSPFPSAAAGAALDNPGLPGRYPTRQNPPSGDNRAVPLGKAATAEERAKIAQVMHEHKAGTLRSYRGVNPRTGKPRRGPKVTDRKQAIAIALSQASRLGKMHDPVLVAALTDRLEKQSDGIPTMSQYKIAAAKVLSPAQHAQRITAAKARWKKEGLNDGDAGPDYYDQRIAKAKKSTFFRASKVAAATAEHDAHWHGVADAQAAYDKMRPHLHKTNGLMISVPPEGVHLYNPEELGPYDKPEKPMYMLHPHEVDDWISKYGKKPKTVRKDAPFGLIEDPATFFTTDPGFFAAMIEEQEQAELAQTA